MADPPSPRFDYLASKRHVLVDMQTPDWEESLLRDVDPARLAELSHGAGAEAAMLYCNSHVGLANWPTGVGPVHRNLGSRDLVAELLQTTHDHEMAACAYYSLIFNNWAYLNHPEWRLVPAVEDPYFTTKASKYGVCCPNNPDFYDFEREQIAELASGYPFDAFFLDMVFWAAVCVCDHCEDRWAKEGGSGPGAGIPTVVNWYSPEWCGFQAARERWLTEHYVAIAAEIKRHRDIPVFLNASPVLTGWVNGIGHDLLARNDLLGGDPIAPDDSALAFGLLLADLSPTAVQFMYGLSGWIGGASCLATAEEQKLKYTLPMAALGGQCMAIDAVEADGTVNPAAYDEVLTDVFSSMKRHEAGSPGTLIGDVGVYWSLESLVDFADNGKSLADPSLSALSLGALPHLKAVTGILDTVRSRLPVKVVTRKDLSSLSECPLIVLPDVMRMDESEVAAIREYVENGGRLLASGHSSLVSTSGTLHDDFMLADVFGCHFAGFDDIAVGYAHPIAEDLAAAIAPLRFVPISGEPFTIGARPVEAPAIKITADDDAEVLSTVARPFGHGRGTRYDEGWSSIHAAPPFAETSEPSIVRHRFGRGEAVFVSGGLEARAPHEWAARKLLEAVLGSLLPKRPSFEVRGDPEIWVVGRERLGGAGIRLAFLNYPSSLPARPTRPLDVRVQVPGGRSARAEEVLTGNPVSVELDDEGRARFELGSFEEMTVVELLFEERQSPGTSNAAAALR